MVSWSGATADTGAVTPFTVAETPAILSASGKVFACAVAGASCEPVTVISMPGANAPASDAAFAALAIVVVEEAPTTITTVTLAYPGAVLAAVTITVAR